jgi:ethanolaminephosphotransferase
MPYVSEQGAKNILKYKYDGEDKSYVYRFILTPMNNWLISFVPLWMAPNLITTIGGLLILSAHLLTLWYR